MIWQLFNMNQNDIYSICSDILTFAFIILSGAIEFYYVRKNFSFTHETQFSDQTNKTKSSKQTNKQNLK